MVWKCSPEIRQILIILYSLIQKINKLTDIEFVTYGVCQGFAVMVNNYIIRKGVCIEMCDLKIQVFLSDCLFQSSVRIRSNPFILRQFGFIINIECYNYKVLPQTFQDFWL